MINCMICLVVIVCGAMMGREILCQWREDDARRAANAMDRAMETKYMWTGTPEELAEFDLTGRQG